MSFIYMHFGENHQVPIIIVREMEYINFYTALQLLDKLGSFGA